MNYQATANAGSFDMANIMSGTLTSDGTELTVKLGFRPRAVTLYNADTEAKYETTDTMDGAAFRTVTAGTQTLQADQITITDQGFVVAAAIMTDTEEYHFLAMR